MFVAVSLAASIAIAGACGFPDPLLSDGDTSTTDDAGDAAADSTTDATNDAAKDVVIVPPDAGEDVKVILEDAAPVDPSTCDGSDCDCDKDGVPNKFKLGCEDAGPVNDCDDLDSRVRPTYGPNEFVPYLPEPDAGTAIAGDWNCDRAKQPAYNIFNLDCASRGVLLGIGNCAATGFKEAVVDCGRKGTLITCAPGGFLNSKCLTVVTANDTPQSCR